MRRENPASSRGLLVQETRNPGCDRRSRDYLAMPAFILIPRSLALAGGAEVPGPVLRPDAAELLNRTECPPLVTPQPGQGFQKVDLRMVAWVVATCSRGRRSQCGAGSHSRTTPP